MNFELKLTTPFVGGAVNEFVAVSRTGVDMVNDAAGNNGRSRAPVTSTADEHRRI